MTAFTKPIFEILIGRLGDGGQDITYKALADRLVRDYGLSIVPIGLGSQLGALSALLDRVAERSSIVIPPLTAIVVNSNGEPSYGVAPVFVLWLRRRPQTPPMMLKRLAALPYGADPEPWAINLARNETRAFKDWAKVGSLISWEEWESAPLWHAGLNTLPTNR